jgi:selenocysteine lyase/cysteine desulfurase
VSQDLYEGLVKQGVFTPPGNRSSIVTFNCSKPVADARTAFQAANIEVTVRPGQVRIAPALFNNADEIEKCLAVTKRLA